MQESEQPNKLKRATFYTLIQYLKISGKNYSENN